MVTLGVGFRVNTIVSIDVQPEILSVTFKIYLVLPATVDVSVGLAKVESLRFLPGDQV
jgi:hypothetical protein